MKFRVNLDYNRPAKKEGDDTYLTPIALTSNYIDFAVSQQYPDGLQGQQRRIYGRIQRKMDDAIDNSLDEVELESAEVDFIREAFKAAKFNSFLAKFVTVLEDELAKLS